MADNNDGHSNGEIDPHSSPLLIYFSGDDMSVGMSGPAGSSADTDYFHQSTRLQAAGDRFVTNGPTTVSPAVALATGVKSFITPPVMLGGRGNSPINLLSANQHRYNEIPSILPAAFNTYFSPGGGTPMDDMDALELTPFVVGDVIHTTPIYFSLDAISPSLGAVGAGSGADVLLSLPLTPTFGLFAPASMLGLDPADEVDALAIWDDDLSVDPGTDFALFSLAPGSPSLFISLLGDANHDGVVSAGDYASVQANFGAVGVLGGVLFGDANRDGKVSAGDYASVQVNFGSTGGMSAADIFVTDFSGMNMLYLSAMDLGMLPTDNIDAIDVEIWDPDAFPGQLLDQTFDDEPVPEPTTITLLALSGLAMLRRRRK